VVSNLRVADHRTYFVGGDTWSFAVWAHNRYSAEVNQIIRELVIREGGLPANGFSYEASRTGERATWANRQYLREHLRAMLDKYYPTLSTPQKERITECAATRILQLANREPQANHFVPQETAPIRPTIFTVPTELRHIAHRRYTLTNSQLGVQGLLPIVTNLNRGNWEVTLATVLGDTSQRKAKGVYVLRDPESGRIYKVGKAESTGLVQRLESYAKDWVARGIRVQAEVYKLPGDCRIAERVLRYRIREDGWNLNPASGAADGTYDEILTDGTAGWSVGVLD
jgi:hypothetical protein